MGAATIIEKKCWDDLMAVLEFNSLSPFTMLTGVMLSTSLLYLSTLLSGGRRRIWVEEGLKLHSHYCLKNAI